MNSEDDLRNVYNPGKEKNFWPSSSEDIRHMGKYGRNGLYQITPNKQDGLVPAPKDPHYEVPF